jgi:hypothetical protein
MDPHLPEYLAAAGNLHEQTPTPSERRTAFENYSVGDEITFRLAGWSNSSSDSGRVCDMHEERLTLLVETSTDVVELDPRPWPVGNVLPF